MPIGVSQAFHVNVNCSDLERSLSFYRDLLGLRAAVRTRPEQPQDGAVFALASAQWDAWILHDDRGLGAGLAVDLLQWQVPPPAGRPPGAGDLGFCRLGLFVADLDARLRRLAGGGGRVHGAPHATGVGDRAPVRTVVVEDPDGVLVELVEVGVDRVGFVAVGVSDLAASRAFYEDVLGFRFLFERGPLRQPGEQLGLPGEIELRAAYLDDPRGAGAFMLELVQVLHTRPHRAPSRAANQLGMFRLAFSTDDIDRDHEALVARGVRCYTPPRSLEMGPGVPPVRALLFEDPDGAVCELLEPPR